MSPITHIETFSSVYFRYILNINSEFVNNMNQLTCANQSREGTLISLTYFFQKFLKVRHCVNQRLNEIKHCQ